MPIKMNGGNVMIHTSQNIKQPCSSVSLKKH